MKPGAPQISCAPDMRPAAQQHKESEQGETMTASLKIKTFSNTSGGSALFKALGHPLTAAKMTGLIENLCAFSSVALYDPLDQAGELEAFYDFSKVKISGVFVQNIADIGARKWGREAQPATALGNGKRIDALFITAYDAQRHLSHIRHLIPADVKILSLDEARIPETLVTNPRNYLDPINFATNFAFFREQDGQHTRLVTANYWAGYNAKNVSLWCCLFGIDGAVLAQWTEALKSTVHTVSLDSREIAARFKLKSFTGSLFVHAVGIVGHDVVKYALDTYGDDGHVLSCTHDANAWPSDLYAGLPAPNKGEKVLLWVENSHPCPIPANGIGLNVMGSDKIVHFPEVIAPFATRAIDVSSLLPKASWPAQLEVRAGRYFVRPRYEVVSANGRTRIAHANVEREDLKPDPAIASLGNLMGKGYLLPAPILPLGRFRSLALPTPMSTAQDNLPIALLVYNAEGREVAQVSLGKLDRSHKTAVDIGDLLAETKTFDAARDFPGGFGHMELIYDFAQGGSADGWLHGLFRYEDRASGHAAETSFGAHIFNTPLVYKNEPQSYAGKPPGLSTRLFLRLANLEGVDTLCHLVYPASTPWHATSSTDIVLFSSEGTELLKKTVHIPCSGSLLWRYSEMFTAEERAQAGKDAYVMIRDTTCRLFGYHGLIRGEEAFSLDHMFGF
jgi:hypothetical protein